MDLFPLWNSLRIAVISSVIVFFTGIFLRVLRGEAAENDQRRAGCYSDAAPRFTAYGSGIFSSHAVCSGDSFWFMGV